MKQSFNLLVTCRFKIGPLYKYPKAATDLYELSCQINYDTEYNFWEGFGPIDYHHNFLLTPALTTRNS